MEGYNREHGSERTEVRGDGSIAHFRDPVASEPEPQQTYVPEPGTDVQTHDAPPEHENDPQDPPALAVVEDPAPEDQA